MADKYLLGARPGPAARRRSHSRGSSAAPLPPQGIHILLSCMVLAFLLVAGASWLPASLQGLGPGLLSPRLLLLDHGSAAAGWWWVLLTDSWVAGSGQLLARNLALGYLFGRVVDNTEGGAGLWAVWTLSALGGSLSALLLLPRRACLHGCAASGALFGAFAGATLFNRHKVWHWQRCFELAVLLPFVVQQLLAGHASSLGAFHGHALGVLQLPGPWVPLLGGLLGAAAAAGLLALARALAAGVAEQRRQAQQQQQQGQVADDAGPPFLALLAQAATQMLQRALKG